MNALTIPATMRSYGPEHPDYPNEPRDWRGTTCLFDDDLFRYPRISEWERVRAYTPKATAQPDKRWSMGYPDGIPGTPEYESAPRVCNLCDTVESRCRCDAAQPGTASRDARVRAIECLAGFDAATHDRTLFTESAVIAAMLAFVAAQSPRSGVAERGDVAEPSEEHGTTFQMIGEDWSTAFIVTGCNAALDKTLALTAPQPDPDEYMSVTLRRDGSIVSHNAYEADFDEMVLATQTIIDQLQRRLDRRDGCPFGHGSDSKKGRLVHLGQQAWFARNADRSNPRAFINTDPEYFASECASEIMMSLTSDPDARLREALEPFARFAKWYDDPRPEVPDSDRIRAIYCGGSPGVSDELTVGDLRRARQALRDIPA